MGWSAVLPVAESADAAGPGVLPPVPSIESLRLFVSVLRLGSVSKAAAEARLSQPSASARLAGLERQLGVRLLDRGPAGSVPTEEGTVVARWAEAVLAAVEEMRSGVASMRRERSSRLQVAASFTVAEHLLPGWLAEFRRQHPQVTAELEVANSAHVIARVRAGVDLGFVESPEVPSDLDTKVVAVDELVVVVPPGHPWLRRKRAVGPDALADAPLVVRERGSGTRESFERALVAAGAGPLTSRLELGSSSAVVAAVIDRAGPGVLSRLAVGSEISSGQLCVVALEGLDLRRSLRAVWFRRRPLVQAAALLLDSLQAPRSTPSI